MMASSNPDAIESLGDIDGEIYQNYVKVEKISEDSLHSISSPSF